MKTSRPRLIALTILVLLTGMLTDCAPGEGDESETETEIVTVQRGSLTTGTTATGSVLPGAEVTLSFEVSGQVSDVLVQVGARVTKDQALAQLDTSDLELQVRSAEARLASAKAQLDQLKAGPQPEEVAAAEANLAASQAALTAASAERQRVQAGVLDAEIAAAEAQVASALSQQKNAQIAHDNTMKCQRITMPDGSKKKVCPGLGDPEEQARFNLHAAEVALEAAQAQLEALQDSADFQIRALWANEARALGQRDAAQAQLDLLLAGATDAQIATAEANVDQAQVALDSARLAQERATLRAPFDSVVSRVDVEVGESVGPQTPVITLVDDSRFRVEADVDEADIGWVELGQEVQISLDAFPGHGLGGRVTAIAPSARYDLGVVSYVVTIEISETDLTLRGGMTANTEIVRERREDVLLVPNRAIWIDAETGRPFVEELIAGEVVVTYIEQGVADDLESEVLVGLEKGDQLVIRSASIQDRFRSVVTQPFTGHSGE
jgi:RND family efflux transporter MFP subunit